MATITLTLPDKTKEEMAEFKWVNWSELAKIDFLKQVKKLAILSKFNQDFINSSLSEEESIELGRKLRKDISKHYKKKV